MEVLPMKQAEPTSQKKRVQNKIVVQPELSYELNERLGALIAVTAVAKRLYPILLSEKVKKLAGYDELDMKFEQLLNASKAMIKELNH